MKAFHIGRLVARIEAELRRRGDPERADGAKRYLKSELAFLGADTRAVREMVRGVLKNVAPLDRTGLLALVNALWPHGVFELRAVAVEVLKAPVALLVAAGPAPAPPPRRGRLRALLAVRRRHARGKGVLHPQGDRLGASRDGQEAAETRGRVAGAPHQPRLGRDRARGGPLPPAGAPGGIIGGPP